MWPIINLLRNPRCLYNLIAQFMILRSLKIILSKSFYRETYSMKCKARSP